MAEPPGAAFERLAYGHGDEARPAAPEPVLLAAAAPYLPAGSVAHAVSFFTAAWGFNFAPRPGHAALVAKALAPRLGDAEWLDLWSPGLDDLAPYVEEGVRERLSGEAASLDPERRALLLAALAEGDPAYARPALDACTALDAGPHALVLARVGQREEALATALEGQGGAAALALALVGASDPALARASEAYDALAVRATVLAGGRPEWVAGGDLDAALGVVEPLREALGALPADEAAALASRLVDDLYARWGGSAPDAAAPPADELEAAPPPPVARNGGGGPRGAPPPPAPAAPPEPKRGAARKEAARHVNVGFASWAGRVAGKWRALRPRTTCLFWVEIGELLADSIGGGIVPAPVPEDAELEVAVFGIDFNVRPRQALGRLLLTPAGAKVLDPAHDHAELPRRDRRLYFPVEAPARGGTARLRCSLYYDGTLVQSLLVEASVGRLSVARRRQRAHVDFALARRLDPGQLRGVGGDRLSLMLNHADGTDTVFVHGPWREPLSAPLDPLELEDHVTRAREALRLVSWGTKDEWSEGLEIRYPTADRTRLAEDLFALARAGQTVFGVLVDRLVERAERRDALALIAGHERIQVAIKDSPRLVVPAALLYDRWFDDQKDVTLCTAFLAALDAGEPLADSACFRGECPSRAERQVVCPSGFWGFRHALSLPVSSPVDASPAIPVATVPELLVGVTTDARLVQRVTHLAAVQALRKPVEWRYTESRDELLDLLGSETPDVVYLYCHGGLSDDGRPYLRVGGTADAAIVRSSLDQVVWQRPGPLVFVNGCHTTAVRPEQAVELVSAFLAAYASGVVGTEITVTEPLAAPFAEAFLRRFLAGEELADAMRGARLDLLAQGNPLGLVYIPFAPGRLRLTF